MSRKRAEIEDEVVAQFLSTCLKPDTRYAYKRAMELYQEFRGMSGKELLEEAEEDQRKNRLERTQVVKIKVLEFYNWLQFSAPRTKMLGRDKREIIGKGFGENSNSAHNYLNGVRAFYSNYEFPIKLEGRAKIQNPKRKYERHIYNSAEVKKLINIARSPRDRALILMAFQSGCDIDTLTRMKYSDVRNILSEEAPVKMNTYRAKEGVKYFTFIGHDALEALKTYVSDMTSRGVKFESESPLFLKENYQKGIEALDTANAQQMIRDVVQRAGFNGGNYNIYGFHALRESFGSICISNKIPKSVLDCWLGHTIGNLAEAYERVQFEDVKAMYQSIEPLLSITGGSEKVKERDEQINALQGKVEELSKALNLTQVWKEEAERKLKAIDERLKNAVILDEMTVVTMSGLEIPNEEQRKVLTRMVVNSLLKQMQESQNQKQS
jgi:integrase